MLGIVNVLEVLMDEGLIDEVSDKAEEEGPSTVISTGNA